MCCSHDMYSTCVCLLRVLQHFRVRPFPPLLLFFSSVCVGVPCSRCSVLLLVSYTACDVNSKELRNESKGCNATAPPARSLTFINFNHFFVFNPLPTLMAERHIRIFGTVASSPRAVTDRLLGCVGTVRIDTNYTKPPGPTPRRSARTLRLGVAPESMV